MLKIDDLFFSPNSNQVGYIVNKVIQKNSEYYRVLLLAYTSDGKTNVLNNLPFASWFIDWIQENGLFMNDIETRTHIENYFNLTFVDATFKRNMIIDVSIISIICKQLVQYLTANNLDLLNVIHSAIFKQQNISSLCFKAQICFLSYLLKNNLLDEFKNQLYKIVGYNIETTMLETFYMIWQPKQVALLVSKLPIKKKIDTELSLHNILFLNDFLNFSFAYMSKNVAEYAVNGKRARNRHGACIYLLPKVFPYLTIEELILCYGRNTESLTSNWKYQKSNNTIPVKRWKIVHAEIDCIIKLSKNKVTHKLLSSLGIPFNDPNNIKTEALMLPKNTQDAIENWISNTSMNCITEMTALPLGVFIMELLDNDVNYCSSQACPVCIKALIKTGIAEQTYTTGNKSLINTEKIKYNPNITSEILEKIFHQKEIVIK